MWSMFFVAVAIAALLLYMPGYALIRALRVNRVLSLCLAPLPSLFAYNIAAIICSKAHVFGNWLTVALPCVALCFMALIVSFVVFVGEQARVEQSSWGVVSDGGTRTWLQLGAYVIMGLTIGSIIFLGSLENPSSFLNEFDNVFHLGTIRSFIDSGMCSVFDSRLYATEIIGQESSPYFPSAGSFYPTAWHLLVAMTVGVTSAAIPVAINAVNFCIIAIVFPASVFCLLKALFPDNDLVVDLGCVVALAFEAFPWGFLTFGPLYPNIMGNALLPLAMVCFVSLFRSREEARSPLITRFVFFVVSSISLAFVHPNALFAAVVLLAPYLCSVASRIARGSKMSLPAEAKAAAGYAVCAVAICIIWMAFYFTPFMQNGPLSDSWPTYSGKFEGLKYVVFLALKAPAQWILAMLVLVGVVCALRNKQHRWLVVSYGLACFIFYVNIALDMGLRSILSGAWYMDSNRTAATIAIAGIPLAAVALGQIVAWTRMVLGKVVHLAAKGPVASTASGAFVALLFVVLNFFSAYLPGIDPSSTTFGWLEKKIFAQNSFQQEQIYSAEEQAFVRRVKDVVPEGALIINNPNDGSNFACFVDDINVYYRYLRGYGDDDELPGSVLIRHNLCDYSTNSDVSDAVRHARSQYLLQLDAGDYLKNDGRSPHMWTYDDVTPWRGIDGVDENTPGFELILCEGDMRLYKILGVE